MGLVGGLPPSSRVLPVISTVKVSDECGHCGPAVSVQRWAFCGEILVKALRDEFENLICRQGCNNRDTIYKIFKQMRYQERR